jgi:hypothetical protein
MKKIQLFSLLTFLLFSCASSQQKQPLTQAEQAELIGQGNQIVQQSFQVLSAELKSALVEGGVQNAVGYCHLKASPIVDSISKAFNARISRISIKYRNPANSPDTLDLTIINAYARQLAEGQALQPHLEYSGNNVIFYSPIVIQNPMCLLCHGEPGKTIDQANYDFIRSKYPDDLATGYQLGDLRGVWKVQFISFNK